jgi:hypothetical protein
MTAENIYGAATLATITKGLNHSCHSISVVTDCHNILRRIGTAKAGRVGAPDNSICRHLVLERTILRA